MNSRRVGSILLFLILILVTANKSLAQSSDSVDVTFYYYPEGNPTIVYLPGEFNNWGQPYSNNKIVRQDVAMQKDAAGGFWWKTVRLRIGGQPGGGVPGAYQYKFNENGDHWLSDPRNPRQNPREYNNSYLYITDPTIHYLLPNSLSDAVRTAKPEITAYIFPSVGAQVVDSSITVIIDDREYTKLGDGYDAASHLFSFVVPDALPDGEHTLKLVARSSTGSMAADSTTFTIQAGVVQLLTRSNDRHLRPTKTIAGVVLDATIGQVTVVHNGNEITTPVINGQFSYTADLVEGENRFSAYVIDSDGQRQSTAEIVIVYVVNHAPRPTIETTLSGSNIIFSATGNDPDGDAVSFLWTSDDQRNPTPLNVNTSQGSWSLKVPSTPGQYYLRVKARDPQGHEGMAQTYFEVFAEGQVWLASTESNPSWVRDAIVYEIFLPAYGRNGDFQTAKDRLYIVKDLGANVIWLTPIYENGEQINEVNAGYNITDFFAVHPQLGTIDDFRAFVDEAHRLGMRVILDITPNHVSAFHPWLQDIQQYRDFSNYRPFVETRILGDDRGLGQFATIVDGYPLYAHYSNWTLANLNYSNIEMFDYMMGVFKHWVLTEGVDGYRMDVYWGPQNRYGKNALWRPFRQEMKRVQPDLFIIGETDATGFGTENNFPDAGGAADAAYDWNFYRQVISTLKGGSVSELDKRVRNYSPNLNYNHYTGPNSHYFRFLENHDEPRLAAQFKRELNFAAATLLFTVPGIPLIYAGQEVGETSQRGKINWQRQNAPVYFSYYRRLARIRNDFATFRSPKIKPISSGHSRVYAFLRPMQDQNAVVAINFSDATAQARLRLSESDFELSTALDPNKTYYFNDVLNDTFYVVTQSSLDGYAIQLPRWGARVMILADSIMSRVTSVQAPAEPAAPARFALHPNYPNPFNPETRIVFETPREGRVELVVLNALGHRVATLVNGRLAAGRHEVLWRAMDDSGQSVPSGVYFVQLRSQGQHAVRKIVLVR
ncbi:MAG: alpha-amylase family glycosyl hydrolase [candidate division KSB1 bacterium]|nr:alpha-amylase family glycosyl hydrolase [candidate division KSB1 bacterium]